MQIWYQSSAQLGSNVSWKPYELSLEKHLRNIVRSDTKIHIHGLDVSSSEQEKSRYVEYLNTAKWIDNALIAEKECYDVFAGGCMLDLGFLEIREVVNIPVVFAAETSFHIAAVLAHKFSLLAYNESLLLQTEELVKQYGLWDRYVSTGCLNISIEELREGFSTPAPVVSAVRKAAQRGINNGAGIFVPSCNILNMVLIDSGTREIDGVPILDNVGVGIKMAELLVDLKEIGVTRSKKGFRASLSKQELIEIRRLYGCEK